jgi:hypothetical protein
MLLKKKLKIINPHLVILVDDADKKIIIEIIGDKGAARGIYQNTACYTAGTLMYNN